MRFLAAPAALALLVAGCLGPSDPAAEPVPDLDPVATAEFSATQGAIDGSIVDESQLPVVGVKVLLATASATGDVLAETLTGPDGRFLFHRLEPTSYLVTAAQEGFQAVTQLVEVHAGQAATPILTLSERASTSPYLDIKTQAGLINCAFAVVAVSGVCVPSVTEPVFGPYNVALFYDIPVGHQAVVSETDWAQRSQVMRNWFFHDETRDANFEGDWMGDAVGPAVLRKEFRADQVPGSFNPTLAAERLPFPSSDQNLTFLVVTYYDGSYQEEINGTASPVCALNPVVGYCTGAGAALQLRFDNYLTTFVHAAPVALDAYSAAPDE